MSCVKFCMVTQHQAAESGGAQSASSGLGPPDWRRARGGGNNGGGGACACMQVPAKWFICSLCDAYKVFMAPSGTSKHI